MKKNLLLVFALLLTAASATAALEKDAQGNYYIGTVQDWKDFAALINNATESEASARMIADIDLGTDQAVIGNYHFDDEKGDIIRAFKGTFDGQGHTLTVHLDSTDWNVGLAPFMYVDSGAVIMNLHVDGSVTNGGCSAAGIACRMMGDFTVSRCWSSVRLQSYDMGSVQGTIGGFLSWTNAANSEIIIEDCIFTGEIVNIHCCAGFMSHNENFSTTVKMKRGLQLGTHASEGSECGTFIRPQYGDYDLEESTLFYGHVYEVAQGTKATEAALKDGTINAVLQAGRIETVWEQGTDRPELHIFNAPKGKDEQTGMKTVENTSSAVKVIRNGKVYILRGEKTYSIDGVELK